MIYISCIVLAVLLGRAAWADVVQRRVPNRVVVGIGLLWLPHAIFYVDPSGAAAALGIAVSLLIVGIVAWHAGWLGAGDVKLMAALGLWSGPDHIVSTLIGTAAIGGLLALVMLLGQHLAPYAALFFAKLASDLRLAGENRIAMAGPAALGLMSRASVPYGVAIAGGGFLLIYLLLAAA